MDNPRQTRLFFLTLFAIVLALRLCHSSLLWPDEDYHLAAAQQLLHGKIFYRDFWYDKPPLSALTYAILGAPTGWQLRFFDATWILGICAIAFRLTRELFSEREAVAATALTAFFLSFDLPDGIIPIAPDFFLILPHLLAIWCAWRKKPLAAGGWCGIAFLFNPKGIFVLAVCGAWMWRDIPLLLAGFAIPNAVAAVTLAAQGALTPYFEQVWKWGSIYAKTPPAASTFGEAIRRSLGWIGFHAALVLGCIAFWWKERTRTARLLAIWAAVSCLAVASGGRFSHRYFLQLLPVLAIAAGCGLVWASSAGSRWRALVLVAGFALIVPIVRFGPRYILLATNQQKDWADAVLDRDSRAVSDWLRDNRQPGDTLFVWGYRPDVFAWTRMPVASLFWDSQPLTGVPADRHLTESTSLIPEWAAVNRLVLTASRPAWIVDGLSLLNPRLAIDQYPELRTWLRGYEPAWRTPRTVVYRRCYHCPSIPK